ncbi:MAG: hypothetical protein O3A85_13350 [Proteobacteria bacterium]|nr:hypothetical protein [Pseudomonadota bacterium]
MTQPKLSDRKFGLIFASIFAIFTIVGWYGFDVVLRWAIVCSVAFLALALFVPGLLMPLNRLWGVVTGRIHRVVNFTLLAAFFYLVIFPFGLIMRLFGRDAMRRAPVPKAASYWQPVTRHTDETTLHDMF